jgi:hypothetical protein
MASPYELLSKLQASASKSEEEKLEEEAKIKLAKGEELSEQERQILTYGVEELQRRGRLKEQIQERDAAAEKYTADITKKEEAEKEQAKIDKYKALDLPVPGSLKEEIPAPVGLGPTPDRMYNALEPEAKPTSLLEATQKAQQKTKAPKPAATPEGASLSLTGEEKAPPAKEPTIQETLKERLSGLDARRTEAKAEREQKRKEADWGQLASIIGRSLAQIGAAQQGLRTGVDMSKAVGPALIDWEKKKDRIDADYAQNIKELESERREATRLAERAEDQEIRDRYRKEDYEKQKELENLKYNNKLRKDNAKGILSEAKAMMKGDIASFKNNIAAEKGKLKDYEGELAKLNQLKGSIAADVKQSEIIKMPLHFLVTS